MRNVTTMSGFKPTKVQLALANDVDQDLVDQFLDEGQKIYDFKQALQHLSKRFDRGIRASIGYALREAQAKHDRLGFEIAAVDMPQLGHYFEDDDMPF